MQRIIKRRFNTASCWISRMPDHHKHLPHVLDNSATVQNSGRIKSCRRNDRPYLNRGIAKRVRHCFIHTHILIVTLRSPRQLPWEIHSASSIFQHALPVFKQQQKVEIKVDSEQDHKHGDHAVNICAVIKCNARISVGESSCSRRTERMNDSIIQIHSAKHKEDHFRDRQNKIHLSQANSFAA